MTMTDCRASAENLTHCARLDKHESHADSRDHITQETKSALRKSQPNACPHASGRLGHKTLLLMVFTPQGLDHTQRRQDLVDDPQGGNFQFLYTGILPAHATVIDLRDSHQEGENRHGDEGKLPIETRRHIEHRQEGYHQREERNDAVYRQPLDSWRIILDTVNRIGGPTRVVESKGQALHMPNKRARKSG